jgi:glyoxylase-like metal-dependent hydrolase (beta-lactamase superfamily II)
MSSTTARAYVCEACGSQHAPTREPPASCAICEDDRQYVPPGGQRWTTLEDLRAAHRNVMADIEPGLTSIRTEQPFAIHHSAFLVETDEGNVLWDPIALIDDATLGAIRGKGGVRAIAVSHPHFYTTMVEWSHLLGGVPIHIHAADAGWIQRPDPAIAPWEGTPPRLPGGLSLVHTGGHFAGSQVLHWPAGAGGQGAIFVGDEANVCADPRWVSFMHSFPNYIPLGPATAERVAAALRPLAFDRIYGWRPERVVPAGARECIERSLVRHLAAMRAA